MTFSVVFDDFPLKKLFFFQCNHMVNSIFSKSVVEFYQLSKSFVYVLYVIIVINPKSFHSQMSEVEDSYKKVLDIFKSIISVGVENFNSNHEELKLPIFPYLFVEKLCSDARVIFSNEDVCLKLPHNLIIIGDLHGHILDLFRILENFGFPPEQNYLFLGDIVDRGEFSTETIVLVLLLKVLFPKNVFLIRGNHEFSEMIKNCGFEKELFKIFGDRLYQQMETNFINTFAFIPLSAIINNKILCVHGGIGPRLQSIQSLTKIHRPLFGFDGDPQNSILWSDPLRNFSGFKVSQRGSGFMFGLDALSHFLHANKLTLLVRGHECVMGGCEQSLPNKCITVFSASFYCGITPNMSGIMVLKEDSTCEFVKYQPLKYYKREKATFHYQVISPLFPYIPIPVKSQSRASSSRTSLPLLSISSNKKRRSVSSTGRPIHVIPAINNFKQFHHGIPQKTISNFPNIQNSKANVPIINIPKNI